MPRILGLHALPPAAKAAASNLWSKSGGGSNGLGFLRRATRGGFVRAFSIIIRRGPAIRPHGRVARACASRHYLSGYARSRTGASNGQEAFNPSATGTSTRFPKALGGKQSGETSHLAGRSPPTTHCLQQALACGKSGLHQAATTEARPEGIGAGGRRVSHGVRFDVPFVGGRSGPAAVDAGSLHLVKSWARKVAVAGRTSEPEHGRAAGRR